MNRLEFIQTISSATLSAGLPFSIWASKPSGNSFLAGYRDMAKDDDFVIRDIDTFMLKKALFVSVELNNGIKGWAEAMPNDKRSSRTLIEKTLKNYF